MVFKTNNTKIIEKFYDIIDEIIHSNQLDYINLVRGFYQDKSVIQIGTTTKDKAIKKVEKIIGVPEILWWELVIVEILMVMIIQC